MGLRTGAPARCICQAPDHRAVHGPWAAGGEWRNAMRDLPASRVRRPGRCARRAGASCGVPGRASRRRQPCRRGPRAPCRGGLASSSLVSPCLGLSRLISAYLAQKNSLQPISHLSAMNRAGPLRIASNRGRPQEMSRAPAARAAGRRPRRRGSVRPAPPAGFRPQSCALVGGGASAILPPPLAKGRAEPCRR